MKYVLPTIFCIPTVLIAAVFIPIRLAGYLLPAWSLPILVLAFLGLTACIALTFVNPEAREWRIAAIVTGIPWFLLFIFAVTVLPFAA